MGPGGPRGLQILLPGAKTIRGGFDSHTFPPAISGRRLAGGLLLCLFLCGPLVSSARAQEPGSPPVSPFWASVRSLVFPGWGQLSNGSERKAVVVFSLQTYFLSRVFVTERRARYYRDRADDPEPAWDPEYLEERYKDLRDRRADMLFWTAITLLYSVIDAYVDAHMVGFEEDVSAVERVTWTVTPGDAGGASVALRATF